MGARTFLPRSFKARTFLPRSLAGADSGGAATDVFTTPVTLRGQTPRTIELAAVSQTRFTLHGTYTGQNMVQEYTIHAGDTRTVLTADLKQESSSGVEEDVDLTGLTVEFKMVDCDGTAVISQTTSGVTVTNAAAGRVAYDFSSSGVATPGTYYGYFVVTDSGETDHFPVNQRDLIIHIEGD